MNSITATTKEDPAINSLTDICSDLGAPLKSVRTLVIEHDIPFEIVGASWAFTPKDTARVKDLWKAHMKKCEARGLKSRPHRIAASA